MADQITRTIIVKAPAEAAYRAWENFENFPLFMTYIKSVHMTGDRTSHWVMQGLLGKKLEWDAETTRLEPGKRIAWNSKRDSSLKTSGQVTFNQLPDGDTEVTVTLHYDPPAGWAGDLVAELFGNPEKKLEADLGNFKAYIEGMPDRTHTDIKGHVRRE